MHRFLIFAAFFAFINMTTAYLIFHPVRTFYGCLCYSFCIFSRTAELSQSILMTQYMNFLYLLHKHPSTLNLIEASPGKTALIRAA